MKLTRRTIAGLASLVLSGVLLATGSHSASSAPMRFGLVIFALTSLTILTLRLTRTITLRNRRVDRRLLVLLAFATIVPAVLVGALGAATAWLSAASDRARSAKVIYESETRRLRDELGVALEGVGDSPGPDAAARLRSVAALHARRGEYVSIWLSDGAWNLVAGDSVVSAAALRAWPADSTGAATMAIVREVPYAAARVGVTEGGHQRVAIALVPADGALKNSIAREIAAPLDLPRYTAAPSKNAAGPASKWAGGSERTIDLYKESFFRGFAALHGLLWTGAEWIEADQFLMARLPFLAWRMTRSAGSPSLGNSGKRVTAPKRRASSGRSSGSTSGLWIRVSRPFGAAKVASERIQASSAPSCMMCAAARPESGAGRTVPSAWKGGLAITWS